MGVADLFTTGSVFLVIGFFGALDEAAVGDKILDGREAADRLDLVEDHQSREFFRLPGWSEAGRRIGDRVLWQKR